LSQWITEQNTPTKQSFWGIKRDFIAISDFHDASALVGKCVYAFVCGALSSDNHMVCFHRKTFLKSDKATGLTSSGSGAVIQKFG
jgi:hypothetical protein